MKEERKPITVNLPICNLYPEDVHEIYELLEKHFKYVKIEVEDKNTKYILERPEEIKNLKPHNGYLKEISFKVFEKDNVFPIISVHCHHKPYIIIEHQFYNTEMRGLAEEIKDLFRERKSFIRDLFSSSHVFVLVGALYFAIIYFYSSKLATYISIVFWLIIFSAPFLWIPSTIIFTKDKNERQSFLKRNWEPILAEILAGIVILIIGILIGKFIQ